MEQFYFVLKDDIRDQLTALVNPLDNTIIEDDLNKFRTELGKSFENENNFDKFLEIEIDIDQFLTENDIKLVTAKTWEYPFRDNGAFGRETIAAKLQDLTRLKAKVVCEQGNEYCKKGPERFDKIYIQTNPAENNQLLRWHEDIILAGLRSYGFTGEMQKKKISAGEVNYIAITNFDQSTPEAQVFLNDMMKRYEQEQEARTPEERD